MMVSLRQRRQVRFVAALAVWLAAGGRTAGPPLNAPPAALPAAPRPVPPTGRLSGVVIDTDIGSPIEGARIDVRSLAIGKPRLTLTDSAGRYEVGQLPAGLYTVTASMPAYVTSTLGYRRLIGTQGTIPLADGEQRDRVDFRLTREAVITGRVLGEDGTPLAGAVVDALRPHLVEGQRRLASFGGARTDAQGRFRVAGLPPGDYYVSAYPMVALGGEGAVPRYSPTYYPGSADAAGARRVRVQRGSGMLDHGRKGQAEPSIHRRSRDREKGICMPNDHIPPEQHRQQAEDVREKAEDSRQDAEQDRGFTEEQRISAESARTEAEDFRQLAEEARKVHDQHREALETVREEREHLRGAGETARVAAEEARAAAEAARQAAMEAVHATAETLQATLEHLKVVEEMRRILRDIRDGNKLDSN